jgi:hypothetical protein
MRGCVELDPHLTGVIHPRQLRDLPTYMNRWLCLL